MLLLVFAMLTWLNNLVIDLLSMICTSNNQLKLAEMDRNTLFTSIKRLRARKEQLLREVQEVSLEIDIQNTKYSQFLNDDAPVYRLPDEILTHIFFLVQRKFHYSSPRRLRHRPTLACKCLARIASMAVNRPRYALALEHNLIPHPPSQ